MPFRTCEVSSAIILKFKTQRKTRCLLLPKKRQSFLDTLAKIVKEIKSTERETQKTEARK